MTRHTILIRAVSIALLAGLIAFAGLPSVRYAFRELVNPEDKWVTICVIPGLPRAATVPDLDLLTPASCLEKTMVCDEASSVEDLGEFTSATRELFLRVCQLLLTIPLSDAFIHFFGSVMR